MAGHIICFVSFRFVSFRFVSFRFDLFRFVSICFVSFRFVSFRFDLFRFVSVSFRTLQGPVKLSICISKYPICIVHLAKLSTQHLVNSDIFEVLLLFNNYYGSTTVPEFSVVRLNQGLSLSSSFPRIG